MKRRQLITWCALENEAHDCHVIPIRASKRGGLLKVVQRRHMLGHLTGDGVRCWCKPKRDVRQDGTLLFTHEHLVN